MSKNVCKLCKERYFSEKYSEDDTRKENHGIACPYVFEGFFYQGLVGTVPEWCPYFEKQKEE